MEVNINIRINDEVAEEHKDRVLESCIEKVKYDIESGCNQGELIVEFEDDDEKDVYYRGWWSKQDVSK